AGAAAQRGLRAVRGYRVRGASGGRQGQDRRRGSLHRRLLSHRRSPRLRAGAGAGGRHPGALPHTPRVLLAGVRVLLRLPGLYPGLPGALLHGGGLGLPVALGHTLGLGRGTVHGRRPGPAGRLSLLHNHPAHADDLARRPHKRPGATPLPAAEDPGSRQRTGPGFRDRREVRPDLYRGDGAPRPRPDRPRRPLRRGRRRDPRPPPRTTPRPHLHKRLRPRRHPHNRHAHPLLPRRKEPNQAPRHEGRPPGLAGARPGHGLDAGGLATL
ncbi:MAG: Transmembrane component of energizing module of predicted pantothenate ECF transporter, partial [uncultured Rubrobacteraceae bacterium]